MSTEGTLHVNCGCADLTTCNYDTHYQSQAPTRYADRKCTPLTTCRDNEYRSRPNTKTSDRVRTAHTACNIPDPNAHTGGHYISLECTLHVNRECTRVSILLWRNRTTPTVG